MRNDSQHKAGLSLPLIGIGIAAGWFLRKLLQQRYEEVAGEGNRSTSDREMIETVFGEYSSQARRSVAEVRREVNTRMKNLKLSIDEVDTEKYKELVRDAIESVGREGRLASDQMTELQDYLIDDFKHVRKAAEDTAAKKTRSRKSASQDKA